MGYVLLTDEDEQILKWVINEVRSGRINRPSSMITPEREEEYFTPEVYLAKPQDSGGIPARSDDTPGQATCDIYRLSVTGGAGGEATLTQVGDLTKTVYNLTTSAISQDYITAVRDKFGRWIAQVSSAGAGAAIISFTVNAPLGVAYGAESFEVDNCKVIQPDNGEYPSGEAPTAVLNTLGVPCDNNVDGIAFYDYVTEQWWGFPLIKWDTCSCEGTGTGT